MTGHSYSLTWFAKEKYKKKSAPDNNTQMTPSYSGAVFLWKRKWLCAFAHIISYASNSHSSCNIKYNERLLIYLHMFMEHVL